MITSNKIYQNIKINELFGFMPISIDLNDDEMICRGYWMNISNPRRHYSVKKVTISIKTDDIVDWIEVKPAYTTTIYGGLDNDDNYREKNEHE